MKPRTERAPSRAVTATRQARGLPALVALVLAGLAGAAQAANLGAIYELALAHDAVYAAAVQTAVAGREKLAQGRALLRPTIAASGDLRRNDDASSVIPGGDSRYSSANAALNASQPLFRPVNYYTFRQGELQAQLADEQLRVAEQELLLRIAKGYFDVLQYQDALATLGSQKQAFASQLAQAKRGFQAGLVPITDVNEAQSRVDLTTAQEIAARNDLELRRRTLEKSIAQPLPPLAALDGVSDIDFLPPDQLQALLEDAPQRSWAVAANRTAERIASAEIDRQQASHLPTLDIVASAGKNRNINYSSVGGQNTRTSSIGLELTVPIYQGGSIDSRVREAVANLGRAQGELENARRQATLDASQALLGVQSGIALNKALSQAVTSGETQVRSTRRGLEVGVRTRVDVLNAEQQLYTTLRDLSAARYQALLSGLQLKAAAGALSESDLRGLDGLLREP